VGFEAEAALRADAHTVSRFDLVVPVPTVRQLLKRSGELIRSQAAIFCLLAIWGFGPLVAELVHVARNGGVLTGTNGLDSVDQFQYLAWIRDEGTHLLASNLWVIGHTPHDYVQPMYLISGLIWRLGVGIQVAYLIWKPVALLVLFLGFNAYVRHLLPGSARQQAAALAAALFYVAPVLALAHLTDSLSAAHRFQYLGMEDAYSALQLWGMEHTAIAIGLMPVFLIAAERLLATGAADGRIARGWSAVAAVAGLLVSWLHPWQGVTLLAIVALLVVLKPPRRRYRGLAVPAASALLPLIYGFVLARSDASWRAFDLGLTQGGVVPWWALLAGLGPLVALAALGAGRPRDDREWMLVLWPVACAGVYILLPENPSHALSGVTLPLAVLAVAGWVQARVPQLVAGSVGILAILAFTLPGAVDHALSVRDDLSSRLTGAVAQQALRLTNHQAAALAYIDNAPRAGGVLAPWPLSLSVPEFTGRQTYAGHPMWEPRAHIALAGAFFDSKTRDPSGALHRALLRQSKATFVVAGCEAPAKLTSDIAPLADPVRRFGCVRVYATR
jgi:hypothetical protein